MEKGANANYIWVAFLSLVTTNVCANYAWEKKLHQHGSAGHPSYILAITTSTSPSFLPFQFPHFELPSLPSRAWNNLSLCFVMTGILAVYLVVLQDFYHFSHWIQSHILESLKETQNRPLCSLFMGLSPTAMGYH